MCILFRHRSTTRAAEPAPGSLDDRFEVRMPWPPPQVGGAGIAMSHQPRWIPGPPRARLVFDRLPRHAPRDADDVQHRVSPADTEVESDGANSAAFQKLACGKDVGER